MSRFSNKALTLSEIIFITMLASAMGVIWSAYSLVYDIIAPVLKIFAVDGLLNGIWLIGGIFFPYIIRKPGSAFLGEAIAAIIESVISQWGIGAIVYGILQGIPVELFFLCLGYRNWSTKVMLSAGLISAIASFGLSVVWYQYYKLGINYNLIQLLANAISGIFLAGLTAKMLADNLAKTGVLNQFRIVS
ncbi:MAG: ECF transporter S component, partial [Burkholderiales bacterium]